MVPWQYEYISPQTPFFEIFDETKRLWKQVFLNLKQVVHPDQ